MTLPVVVIELGEHLSLARELAAGRVFVSGCTLPITTDCELIVRGVADQAMVIAARVVFVDPPRGVGLELIDFTTPKRVRLAELVAQIAGAAAAAPDTRAAVATADPPTLRRPLAADDLGDELVLAAPTPAPPPPILDRANRTPSVAPPLRALPDLPPELTPGELDLFDVPTTHRKVDRGFVRVAPSPIDRLSARPPGAPPSPSTSTPAPPAAAGSEPADATRAAPALGSASPSASMRRRQPDRGSRVDIGLDTFQLDDSAPHAPLADDRAEANDDEPDDTDGSDDPDDSDGTDGSDGSDERRAVAKNVHERLRGISLAEQVKTAHSADPQERIALERLYGKNVWEPLLRNPRLTAPEVVRLARMGTMPRVLVEVIVSNGAWLGMPEVRRALLANPRLGADQIPRVLRAMPKHELKLAATQIAYPAAVREVAKRLLRGG